jgi:thymidylate synthase (FAD)
VASILFVTDRGVSHELVRHRLASYCQESTRYVNYGKRQGLHVIEPLGLNEDQSAAWYSGVLQAAAAYERMLAEGCGLDQARDCLPTCVKTEIVMTANFRTWRHVIAQRTSRRAHPKIQALLALASAELHAACPEVFP